MENTPRCPLLGADLPKNAIRLIRGTGVEDVTANLEKVEEKEGRVLGKHAYR